MSPNTFFFYSMCLTTMCIEILSVDVISLLLDHREPNPKYPNSENLHGEKSEETISQAPSAFPIIRAAVTEPNTLIPIVRSKPRNITTTTEGTTTTTRRGDKMKKKSFRVNGEIFTINDNKKAYKDTFNDEFTVPSVMMSHGSDNTSTFDVNSYLSLSKKFKDSDSNREGGLRKTIGTYEICEGCMQHCVNDKAPICAKPVKGSFTEGQIDGETLRGFPSKCHLTCFNMCRKQKYEFVADGRCGQFRSRVKPVDSDKKLTRVELQSAKYDVLEKARREQFAFMPRFT